MKFSLSALPSARLFVLTPRDRYLVPSSAPPVPSGSWWQET